MSPSFRQFLPFMAETYGFEYELVCRKKKKFQKKLNLFQTGDIQMAGMVTSTNSQTTCYLGL